jgi:hypothetical protein
MAFSVAAFRQLHPVQCIHAPRVQAECLRYPGALAMLRPCVGIGVLKSSGEAKLGSDRVLQKVFPEGRRLTLLTLLTSVQIPFVSFCSDFFWPFSESVRENCCEVKMNTAVRCSVKMGPEI